MMRIAIVEDNAAVRHQLREYIMRYFSDDTGYSIAEFEDGDGILFQYSSEYDLILLDIQMKNINGLETARAIRRLDDRVILVFVTNLAEYAIKGYGVKAMDFILKPVNYYMLEQLLSRAEAELRRQERRFVMVSSDDGIVRLDMADILYVENEKHNLNIHTPRKVWRIRDTMTHFEQLLSEGSFFRCNNGCIVNLAHVKRVSRSELTIGETTLPISRGRYRDFMEALSGDLGGFDREY